VSEVPDKDQTGRQQDVDAVLKALDSLMDLGGPDVPDWAAHELTFGQVRLLFLLSKGGPTPMSHIADWLTVGLPTASGAIERLERHGLVARRHRLDDRRVVECQLTESGRRLIDEISGFRLEMMRRILGVLDQAEVRELGRIINLVVLRTQAAVNQSTNSQVSISGRNP
jgi:DNA-binding MarR family transcriptional regulator